MEGSDTFSTAISAGEVVTSISSVDMLMTGSRC